MYIGGLNPGSVGSSPTYRHDHDFSTDTTWFQEKHSMVIYLSCKNLIHKLAIINVFKLNIVLYRDHTVESDQAHVVDQDSGF